MSDVYLTEGACEITGFKWVEKHTEISSTSVERVQQEINRQKTVFLLL